jgi:cytochrome c oxidase subunit 2
MRRLGLVAVLVLVLPLAGCGKQSIVSPRSPQTHNIALLWWWMLAAAAIVFFGAVALLTIAWFRRGIAGLPIFGQREDMTQGLVLLFGIGIPIVALVALFAIANIYLIGQSAPPAVASTSMTVDVIGHQWWWEVRYPRTSAVTANEIHIPVDTRVNVVATTADVIHSFWVPQLARKIDMVPGRFNRVLLEADRPGAYRGQCAEFCGFQHAHMSLYVVAQPRSQFEAWLSATAAPARAPATPAQRSGYRLFMTMQCASCHELRGTSAAGLVGPDLTHIGSRYSLAGVTLVNTLRSLTDWIANPQAIKPGDRMPDLGLSRAEAHDIAVYLESLT